MYAQPCTTSNISDRLNLIRTILKKKMEDELDINFLEKECSCCYDIKSTDDFISCQSNHLICINCVQTHATNTIYQNASWKIKCINTEEVCTSIYSEKDLKKILKSKIYDEFNKLKTKEETQYIFNLPGLNLIQCVGCESYWDSDPNETVLHCRTCKKSTCLKCKEPEHKGKPCDSKRKNIEDKLTEAILLKCSKCSKSIYKEDGCNKITCSCGNLMCWICKTEINGIGYGHFCNTCINGIQQGCSKCHTWDSVDKTKVISKLGLIDSEEQKLANSLLNDNNVFNTPQRNNQQNFFQRR